MLRLYKSFAQRILVALVYLIKTEEAAQGSKAAVINTVRGWRSDNALHTDTVYRALNAYADPEEGAANEDVLLGIFGQLTRKKNDDLDLIDTIVNTLQLPNAANHFNGSYLKMLREAILRPEELIKWRKANAATLKCECGHQFQSSEMVTAYSIGDGTYKFFCAKCKPPAYVACRTCGDALTIRGSFNVLKGADCGCTARRTAAQVPPDAEAENIVDQVTRATGRDPLGVYNVLRQMDAPQAALNAAARRAQRRAAAQAVEPTPAPPAPAMNQRVFYEGIPVETFGAAQTAFYGNNLMEQAPDGPTERLDGDR